MSDLKKAAILHPDNADALLTGHHWQAGREALVGADQHHPASPDGHKGRMSGGSAHNTLFCHRVEQQHLVELIPSVVNLVAVPDAVILLGEG